MGILRAGNREWWLYIFVGAILIALCLAVVYLEPVRTSSKQVDDTTRTVGLKQAPWRIRIHPAGVTRRLSPRSKARLQGQKGQLRSLIRETYDALFLDRRQLVEVIDRSFASQAASAFVNSKAGFSKDAERIQTRLRSARIGIDATNARHAAGQVEIVARARVAGSLVRIRHRSTLWLRRQSAGWKVVAFEIDQKRAR